MIQVHFRPAGGAAIDVLLHKVLTGKVSESQLRNMADSVMDFA